MSGSQCGLNDESSTSDTEVVYEAWPLAEAPPDQEILNRASWIAAGWALFYALYRAYYAMGGTVGMFGTPALLAQRGRAVAVLRRVHEQDAPAARLRYGAS